MTEVTEIRPGQLWHNPRETSCAHIIFITGVEPGPTSSRRRRLDQRIHGIEFRSTCSWSPHKFDMLSTNSLVSSFELLVDSQCDRDDD